VVAIALAGVELGELGDRRVEGIAGAQVGAGTSTGSARPAGDSHAAWAERGACERAAFPSAARSETSMG
jgi:hypothetical protein